MTISKECDEHLLDDVVLSNEHATDLASKSICADSEICACCAHRFD